MHESNTIRAEGVVIAVLQERLYRVQLANGHQFLAFVTARRAAAGDRYALGQRVVAELSPLDLSKGRLVGRVDAPQG
ncbi:MAG: translation initiation factor IF-1 [Verrucomicrobiae bacterium]|nr:translation initiation factor IF-1 [Verrucomicrobiae bacterium]